MERMIETLKSAAEAGNRALQEARRDVMLRHKSSREVVTNCDIASENAIAEVLQANFPGAKIYSEEVGEITGNEDLVFIIDPIDGTHNFIHNLKLFAISIGVYKLGLPYAGVIFAPELGELYCAQRGEGAFLNDRRLETSSVNKLSQAMLAYDNQFHKKPSMLKNLALISERCFTVRVFGSATLDMCGVASGCLEARIFHATKLFDFAAGIVIVAEAGGRVTDFEGREPTLQTTELIVSNGKIHDELRAVLRA